LEGGATVSSEAYVRTLKKLDDDDDNNNNNNNNKNCYYNKQGS
jgi:hypothetical protein